MRGECTETKSDDRITSWKSVSLSPSAAAFSGATNGSQAMTFMPIPTAHRATTLPTLPMPTRPRVFPRSSQPVKLFLSHFPGFHRRIRAREVPREGEHHGHGQLPCPLRVGPRRVQDDDAPLGGGLHVDVVHAGPGPADDLQRRARSDDFPRGLGCRADDQPRGVAELRDEPVRREARLHDELQLGKRRKLLDAFLCQRVRDENLLLFHGCTYRLRAAVLQAVNQAAISRPVAPEGLLFYSKEMLDPVTVISLGGSIIAPRGVDTAFLKGFFRLVEERLTAEPRQKLIIVCGGGSLARDYQAALREVDPAARSDDLDWVGVAATRVNGELLRRMLHPWCVEDLVTDPSAVSVFAGRILVAAGWKPGFSTDNDAVVLARRFSSGTVVNLSNIAKVYSDDPKKNPAAQPGRPAVVEGDAEDRRKRLEPREEHAL